MRVSWPLMRWLRLPSRVALLLGLGALSAAGARADPAQDQPGGGIAPIAHGDRASLDGLLIRAEGSRLYVAEGGGEFQELRLGDIPEALLVQQLIERSGEAAATGIRLTPMRLAGSGGAGFHWGPIEKTDPRVNGNTAKKDALDRNSAPAAPQPAGQAPAGKSDKPVAAGRG